jgi:hypothetical protein
LALQALQKISLGSAAQRIAGRGMGEHHDVWLDHREECRAFVNVLDLASITLFLSVMRSGRPPATIREKCTDTPGGAMAIISGSTVGFPGGIRKPRRARHPFMVVLLAAAAYDTSLRSSDIRPRIPPQDDELIDGVSRPATIRVRASAHH